MLTNHFFVQYFNKDTLPSDFTPFQNALFLYLGLCRKGAPEKRLLGKMKTLFVFGSDRIVTYCINIEPVISQPLCDILYFSINTGKFPDNWKTAHFVPIFKSGECDDRSTYRPISVLPVLSRLFEKLIYDQLYNHFDKNKHLTCFRLVFELCTQL